MNDNRVLKRALKLISVIAFVLFLIPILNVNAIETSSSTSYIKNLALSSKITTSDSTVGDVSQLIDRNTSKDVKFNLKDDNKNNPLYIQFDLGKEFNINRVVMVERRKVIREFEVLISKDGKDWKRVGSELRDMSNKEYYNITSAFSKSYPMFTFDAEMARYVKIKFKQVDDKAFNICEIFITGPSNEFGEIPITPPSPESDVIFKTDFRKTKISKSPDMFSNNKGKGQIVTVETNPLNRFKAVKMLIDNGVGTVSTGASFNNHKGNLVADFRLTPMTTQGMKNIYLMNADMYPIKLLSFDTSGNIVIADKTFKYEEAKAYSLQFVMDTNTGKMDFYMDNNISLSNIDIPIGDSISSFKWADGISGFLVDISSDGDYNAQLYLDSFMIYKGSNIKKLEELLSEVELKDLRLRESLKNAVVLGILKSKALSKNININIDIDKEVVPIIKDGRTLVPVRFISESLGSNVDWNDKTETATINLNGKIVKVAIGQKKIVVDGIEQAIDVPAEVINDRTFLPLRALVEGLGKKVFWDDRGIIIIDDDVSYFDSTVLTVLFNELWGISYFQNEDGKFIKAISEENDKKGIKIVNSYLNGTINIDTEKIYDNDTGTYLLCSEPGNIVLELENEASIKSLGIQWRHDSNATKSNAYKFEIEYSNDNKNWTKVLSDISPYMTNEMALCDVGNFSAKYIKINILNIARITEVSIFDTSK